MAAVVIGIAAIAVSLFVVYFIASFRRNNRLKLSGPPIWPFFGNLFQLDFRRPDLTMTDWGKKYGQIYRLRLFNTTMVIATGYEAVYELLVTKGRAFAGRGKPFRRSLLSEGGRDMILGNPTEPHWAVLRKASMKTVRQYGDNLTRIEALISQMADEFVTKVLTYDGRSVDIRNDIYNFTMKAAFVLIAGRKPEDDEPVLQLTKQFERALITSVGNTTGLEMDCFPWLKYLGHPIYPRLLKTCRLRDQLWDLLWSETKATYESLKNDESKDDVDNLLYISAQMLDKSSNHYQPQIDEVNVKGMFTNVLGGSIATTTSSAYSLLNILLHYRHIYQRLQQEVDQLIGSDRKPCIADRDQMPFTNAVILELLRYTSMVPSFPHAAIEDTTLLGVSIPAGTTVLPLLGAVHHDEQFWGDPWVFRPERFLAEDGSLVPPDHPNRKHVVAFGAGPRVCIGEVFALKRLFIFTTSIIQAFDLQPGAELVSCDPRGYTTGSVLFPPSYIIKLLPRKQN